MVTSDFRPKVKIQPFRACAMKNTQYNPYLWPNRRNFRVFQEIEVEEHHPVSVTNLPEAIQFCSQDALRMHYRQITYEVTLISSDRYKNSSVFVDLATGQIPRSTARISIVSVIKRDPRFFKPNIAARYAF